MFSRRKTQNDDGLSSSILLDQDNFYDTFTKDLLRAKHEVVVESPFISFKRLNSLLPTFSRLALRRVRIIINTKPPEEQDNDYIRQAQECVNTLQQLGVEVLITGGHHRKLAIIDRRILYEGSLNILSQNDSCEIMRRIYSGQMANQMLAFLHLEKFLD